MLRVHADADREKLMSSYAKETVAHLKAAGYAASILGREDARNGAWYDLRDRINALLESVGEGFPEPPESELHRRARLARHSGDRR